MNTTLKSKHEIIDEVASTYTLNTLAKNLYENCVYENKDGNCCAVGRYIDSNKIDRCLLLGTVFTLGLKTAEEKVKVDLEDILLSEYRGHDLDFWDDLQALHDSRFHWDKEGLSEEGKEYVKKLKQKWA